MSDEPSVVAGPVTKESCAELTNDLSGCRRAVGVGIDGGAGGTGTVSARGVVDCEVGLERSPSAADSCSDGGVTGIGISSGRKGEPLFLLEPESGVSRRTLIG